MIDAEEIVRIEPNCRGLRAIHSPHTGIVDWRVVALAYGEDFKQAGGKIYTGFRVDKIRESTSPGTSNYPVTIENNHGEEIRFVSKEFLSTTEFTILSQTTLPAFPSTPSE